MILLDGKKLSQKILDEVRKDLTDMKKKLRLAIVTVGGNLVTTKFIEQKKKTAESIGVDVRIYSFDASISTNELRGRLAEVVHEEKNTGVIVQLPLPEHINAQYILNAVPPEKDVDVLSARALGNFFVGKSAVLPPVVGAVKEFFEEYGIETKGKYAVVVGAGRLVGRPAAVWLMNEGATVSVVNEYTKDIVEFTREADIVISGAGKPKLITADWVKKGAVVIDAGTSVDNQQPATSNQQPEAGSRKPEAALAGDVDFDSVAPKASYITPVPGGIGPVSVALLFKNLFILSEAK